MIDYYVLVFTFFISLVGFFGLNTRSGCFFEDSIKRANRKKVNFSIKDTLSSFTKKIEENSTSEFGGKEVLLNKIEKLDVDFFNILIAFSPAIVSGYVAYISKNINLVILSAFLLFMAFDLYRVMDGYYKNIEKGRTSDESLEKVLGYDKFKFISLKKIDMFNEVWIPIFLFLLIFVSLLKKNDIIAIFN